MVAGTRSGWQGRRRVTAQCASIVRQPRLRRLRGVLPPLQRASRIRVSRPRISGCPTQESAPKKPSECRYPLPLQDNLFLLNSFVNSWAIPSRALPA